MAAVTAYAANDTARRASSKLAPATNLATEAALAAAGGRVLVVLFGRSDCEYCAQVRQSYLGPLAREPAASRRAEVREVDVESDRPLIDPAGRKTTHRAFARDRGVKLVPYVAFFDGQGRTAAAPIIGLAADFYDGYLEDRLRTALVRTGK